MKKILALIGIVIFLASCNDDTSTNPDDVDSSNSENYFATKQGSYWIYENETENEETGTVVTKDSISLVSISQRGGKESYNCKTSSDNDNNGSFETSNDTETFYATAKGELYIHKDAFLPSELAGGGLFDLADQIEFKSDWIKIADEGDSDWDIVESEIDITIPGLGFNVTGDVDSEGENLNETREVNVNGKMLITYGYKVDINFNGNIGTDIFPIPFPLKFNNSTTYWIAKGIGPVIIEVGETVIESSIAETFPGTLPNQPGSTSTLKTYFISN